MDKDLILQALKAAQDVILDAMEALADDDLMAQYEAALTEVQKAIASLENNAS